MTTSVSLKVILPAALPRFIVVERGGGVVGDTLPVVEWLAHSPPHLYPRPPERLTPVAALDLVKLLVCDEYPYRYREVGRADADAVYDVFGAGADFPRDVTSVGEVEAGCTWVASLARIYPTCCLCGGPMKPVHWDYGHRAAPVADGQCCFGCWSTTVYAAEKAEYQREVDRHIEHAIADGRPAEWVERLRRERELYPAPPVDDR